MGGKYLATFAAGCFWGVEEAFKKSGKVINTCVGYTGGNTKNPTYEQVCTGNTGHAEAVQVEYDENDGSSYEELLKIFWNIHDPTTKNQQGPDIGHQYRSAIFYHTRDQHEMAKKSKEMHQSKLDSNNSRKIVTEIVPMIDFYPAEEYHQKYFEKHPQLAFCHNYIQK